MKKENIGNEMLYACNRCESKTGYEDCFPIFYNLHWCRKCVEQYTDEIPASERERARRWRDNDWKGWPINKPATRRSGMKFLRWRCKHPSGALVSLWPMLVGTILVAYQDWRILFGIPMIALGVYVFSYKK